MKYTMTRFHFGRNWKNFSKTIDGTAIESSKESLEKLLCGISLEGKTFLDIGSGSGLHSIAAIRLGATRVCAFDYDLESVEATRKNFDRFETATQINLFHGDILNHEITTKFDIVYSWGVLHHTGDLWKAINNASSLVENEGLFIFSIYKKTKFCWIWKNIKKLYSGNGFFVRVSLTVLFLTPLLLGKILIGHKMSRGMSWYYDAIDWLGGYPYESASPKDIEQFVVKLGFTKLFSGNTTKILGVFGSGCAEYVFKKL